MKFRRSLSIVFLVLCVLAIAATVAAQAKRPAKRAYLDANTINYIRPGVKVKVASAAIAKDGTITARATITDPKGVPLDKDGITSPGAVTMRLIAAYIPAGQKQYVSYTTTVLKAHSTPTRRRPRLPTIPAAPL